MSPEPREREDYGDRQIEAARRVLVDLGQVLAKFVNCLVVIGGWVPDLLLAGAGERHIGSIDIDIALDASKLNEGRYADILKLLLDTKRYRKGGKDFQLLATVNLKDGGKPLEVEVDFLAPKGIKLKKRTPKLLPHFRVLEADACIVAFYAPVTMQIEGKSLRGAANTVHLRVASLADFLVMKAHAIGGRDKPKDTYDLCYCLDHYPEGLAALAKAWKARLLQKDVARAIEILREKFASVDGFGPDQLVQFRNEPDAETRAGQARHAYELVQKFLSLL
jgi:hypothetical protein